MHRSRSGGAVGEMGVRFEQLVAAISTLSSGRLSDEAMVTSLRNTMARLCKPTPKAYKRARRLGVA